MMNRKILCNCSSVKGSRPIAPSIKPLVLALAFLALLARLFAFVARRTPLADRLMTAICASVPLKRLFNYGLYQVGIFHACIARLFRHKAERRHARLGVGFQHE